MSQDLNQRVELKIAPPLLRPFVLNEFDEVIAFAADLRARRCAAMPRPYPSEVRVPDRGMAAPSSNLRSQPSYLRQTTPLRVQE